MSHPARKYAFGPFLMDIGENLLLRDGQAVPLTAKAFELLALLLERSGHLLEKQELLRAIWGEAFVEEAVLSVNIAAIRRALSDNGHQYIETVPKRGYRFVAPVREMESVEGGAASEAASATPEASGRSRRLRWGIVAAIIVLAALSYPVGRSALAPKLGNSVAVLPLRSLSDDPEQQHFADAMTDLLLTDLGRIGQLKVVSHQSVLQYDGTTKSLPEIARELNVDCIVEGTVVREGNRVRITAQLIQGPTDRHLWAQSYDRDLGDTLVLQEEVAEAIAQEVGVKLAPTQHHPPPRVTQAAYEPYLRGLYFLDEGDVDHGLEELRKSVAADPNFAPTYTKIASAYFGRAFFSAMPPSDAYPKMRDAALRAIELDESDAEAHAWLATEKLQYEWDWPGAEREFRRSLELNPNDSEVRHMYAHYLLTVGRPRESMAEMDRAFENDPAGLGAAT